MEYKGYIEDTFAATPIAKPPSREVSMAPWLLVVAFMQTLVLVGVLLCYYAINCCSCNQ